MPRLGLTVQSLREPPFPLWESSIGSGITMASSHECRTLHPLCSGWHPHVFSADRPPDSKGMGMTHRYEAKHSSSCFPQRLWSSQRNLSGWVPSESACGTQSFQRAWHSRALRRSIAGIIIPVDGSSTKTILLGNIRGTSSRKRGAPVHRSAGAGMNRHAQAMRSVLPG